MSLSQKNLLGLLALVVASMPISFYLLMGGDWRWWQSAPFDSFDVQATSPAYFSSSDGAKVKNKADRAKRVVAVMIDNHPDARPPAGLSRAKVVYEAPVEFPYTRYMAIFDSSQMVGQVGPARSARPYFLDWLLEYGKPLYMHSGGSPDALKEIKRRGILDADEFAWGEYYWRDKARTAPHDLLTNSALWQMLLKKLNVKNTWEPQNSWKFASMVGVPFRTNITKEVSLPYAKDYTITWKYDAKKMDFVRYLNEAPVLDSEGKEIRARNILVQYVELRELDDEGRLEIMTVGNGSARILKKGQLISGTWSKTQDAGRTRFYTEDKKEIVLLPGTTWVEVMPREIVPQVTK